MLGLLGQHLLVGLPPPPHLYYLEMTHLDALWLLLCISCYIYLSRGQVLACVRFLCIHSLCAFVYHAQRCSLDLGLNVVSKTKARDAPAGLGMDHSSKLID